MMLAPVVNQWQLLLLTVILLGGAVALLACYALGIILLHLWRAWREARLDEQLDFLEPGEDMARECTQPDQTVYTPAGGGAEPGHQEPEPGLAWREH